MKGLPEETSAPISWAALFVNLLTTARLGLAFVFPWASDPWRMVIVIVAGGSDLLDGWISRSTGVTSTFGQVLDPIADKLFVGSVLATLLWNGTLGWGQVVCVGFRDLAVLMGASWEVLRRGWGAARVMPPSQLGKAATLAQFVFILDVLYHHGVTPWVFAVAVGLSVASGVGYVTRSSPRAAEAQHDDRQT